MKAAQKARWAKRKGIAFTTFPRTSDKAAPTMKPKIKRSAAWKAAMSASADQKAHGTGEGYGQVGDGLGNGGAAVG